MRLKLGMVGGGQGAFIGAVHRIAARLDGHWDLVAAALSSDPARAAASAAELGIDRSYENYLDMAVAEAGRADGIDAVAIVTPNHLHAPVAEAFLRAGIHVICDKPLTATMAQAEHLAKVVAESGKQFILTHNYTAYPLIRQARAMVASGALGTIRLVNAEYLQDWLATPLEQTGSKQAEWRTDPARSGVGGAIGDIGTHALNLAGFVTGLQVTQLSADLTSFVPGRRLDDDAQVRLRFAGGAKGLLWASQVATGNENGLRLRVYGDKGGIEWQQENPNVLRFTPLGQPTQILTRAGAGSWPQAARVSRTPAGHPEGYLEGFATIYAEAAALIAHAKYGTPLDPAVTAPGLADGMLGMRFQVACVASSQADAAWVNV
ncbi:Gfo/Idh/MocA family protein [Rhodobacter ferrooxidans]|uniref:Oxidoreductase domain protein n=1 Tax=Rhodobacter ferrooxidans TaxID=371731 RepID=C8S3U3_9RHOB|nr:oxidoreductase domain protein [Rhodobacter sp. SW2]